MTSPQHSLGKDRAREKGEHGSGKRLPSSKETLHETSFSAIVKMKFNMCQEGQSDLLLITHGLRKVIGKPWADQSQDVPDVFTDPRLSDEVDVLSVLEVLLHEISQLNEAQARCVQSSRLQDFVQVDLITFIVDEVNFELRQRVV